MGSGPLTLRLTSASPVTAALRARSAADVAYAGTPVLLEGPTAAPVAGGRPELVLTGADPREAAAVTVETYGPDGDLLGSVDVRIAAGSTQVQRAPLREAARQRAAYVVVRPQEGDVRASALYSGDEGESALALTTPPQTAVAPTVTARE